MRKIIVHIDLNAFFVRCEEIKDPTLIDKPVAIGHLGRSGIVSTCSYVARKFGVSSGMPTFQAVKLCPDLILKSSDFRFYRTLSNAFFKFTRNYTPLVEMASVDECYADFSNVLKNVKDVVSYFKDFQKKLYEETKLTCSIGIAPTKFLAKMGSDYQKPNGLTIIRKRDIPNILYPLSLDKMYGIGKKTAPRLKSIGINTIGDLADKVFQDDQMTMDILGKFFHEIKNWLSGYGNDEVLVEPEDPKSIGNSTTLPHDSNEYDEIKKVFRLLCKEVSERAIEENKVGTTIQIVIKDTNFKSYNKSISFDNPTNDENFIFDKVMNLYEKNFIDSTVRLIGVTLQNLVSIRDMSVQMTLFDYEKHEEESQTKLLINELNRKLKTPSLKRASEVERKK